MGKPPTMATVDLFCGAGGLSYGLKQAGVRICAGIDIDPGCRHPFETNVGARFHESDVAALDPGFVESLFPRKAVKILAGCAPCQPFSCYSRVRRQDRWTMLSKFGDLISRIRPDIVTMENVPGLEKYPVFGRYVRSLENSGYYHDHKIVNCAEHGVPQTRKRLVLLASRLGPIRVDLPRAARRATVRDAIFHLGRITAGSSSSSDGMHRSSGLSERNMRRMRCSLPGGTWRDWDGRLQVACHKKSTGKSYSGVYGRMSWDRPAPTITTQFHGFGSGRFGHPEQHRAISLREGAMLQTFPEDYSFVPDSEDINITKIARLIGNAVPVALGRSIGRCIMGHLESHGVRNGR